MQQLAKEVGQHLGTTIENNEMNLPNEADVLVCGENQINSTGSDVIEVESTNGIQKQELLDNKEVSLPASIQDQELLDNKEVSLPGELTFGLVCGIFSFSRL